MKKICNNCGAPCNADDIYCKSCHQDLSKVDENNESVIEGIDNNALKEYIGKNSHYYLGKFSKAKDKKVFMQLNFSALLFGPTWFIYRKMNKLATVYIAVMVILSSILYVIMPTVFAKDVDNYYTAEKEYSDYVNAGGEVFAYDDNNAIVGSNDIFKALNDDLRSAQNKIILINILISAPVLIVNILFRLFGNAAYKDHIITNFADEDGGTVSKFRAFLVGIVLVNIIMVIISLLLSLIPDVAEFQKSFETFRYYL